MPTPFSNRIVTTALLLAFFLAGAWAAPAAVNHGQHADATVLAQADTPAAPDVAATPDTPTAPDTAAPADATPVPEDLPRMTNKAAAFWGVVFMTSVCIAFAALAGYGIHRRNQQRKLLH